MIIGWEHNPYYERFTVVLTVAHEMGHILGLVHEHQLINRELSNYELGFTGSDNNYR